MIVKKIRSHNDNQYYNAVIDANDGKQNTIAKYKESSTNPILNNPSEYYCSVVRFSIGLETVRIMSFPLDINQNNANKSICAIGIRTVANNYFTQYLTYVPQSTGLIVPTPYPPLPDPNGTFTNAQAVSEYYAIYSVNSFINIINTALAAACVAAGLALAKPPFYVYEPTTQLIKLIFYNDFYVSGARIYLNTYLVNYLSSFQFTQNYNPSVFSNYEDNYYHVTTPVPWDLPNPVAATDPYIYYEEYPAMTLWFDISKIIITTSIPINSEASPAQNPAAGGSQTNITTFQPILTDFSLNFDNISDAQVVANYLPTSQYRLVDITSDTPLTDISFQFYYVDRYGNQFPMVISPNRQANIKVGFFKKFLYANEW